MNINSKYISKRRMLNADWEAPEKRYYSLPELKNRVWRHRE
jgi:hypothetical protein